MIMGAWGMGGKKAPTAKDYVQDGLIAMWDGIENAGWGVHDATATVWKDLSGTNDATITSGAPWSWTTNSFASATRTRYRVVAETDIGGVTPVVGEICYKEFIREAVYSFVARMQGVQVLALGNKICIGQGFPMFDGIAVGAHSVSINWSAPSLYDNSVQVSTTSGSDYWMTQDRLLQIGYFNNTNYPFWGEIYCIRLYSRALTASEIAANYAVDKERFNLP